jgi:hypothetical protein
MGYFTKDYYTDIQIDDEVYNITLTLEDDDGVEYSPIIADYQLYEDDRPINIRVESDVLYSLVTDSMEEDFAESYLAYVRDE